VTDFDRPPDVPTDRLGRHDGSRPLWPAVLMVLLAVVLIRMGLARRLTVRYRDGGEVILPEYRLVEQLTTSNVIASAETVDFAGLTEGLPTSPASIPAADDCPT